MKIEKNMYIRTNEGDIGKVIEIFRGAVITDIDKGTNIIAGKIKKASFNIIDLIEEGDYVNGYKIEKINKPCKLNSIGSVLYHQNENYDYEMILGNEIKSIVTKKQFKHMEYNINEK